MIYTSSYKNFNTNIYNPVSISLNKGKYANYNGECYPPLFPTHEIFEQYRHDNNEYLYIKKYYEEVLSKLDPKEVFNQLNYKVLLCYEDNDSFCHRHIVSAWLNLFLGKDIDEVKINNYNLETMPVPKNIKYDLEEIIKDKYNLNQNNSLEAFYLFEKANHLKQVMENGSALSKKNLIG